MVETDSKSSQPEPIGLPKHFYTHDQERIEHIITDEQLNQLERGGSSVYLEVAIGAAGMAVGLFQNLVKTVSSVQEGSPVEVGQVIGAALFLVAATTTVICLITYFRTRGNVSSLVGQIRARKIGVMTEPGKPFASGELFELDESIPTETSSTTG